MPSSNDSRAWSPPLSQSLLAAAEAVHAVCQGRSLTDALAEVETGLRPGAQALAFHAMRYLGWADALARVLVKKSPGGRFDALLRVALTLIHPEAGSLPGAPQYAAHTVVNQAVRAADSQRKLAPYKGLLNACLRRVLRDGPALCAELADNPVARWNHPQWWVDQLRADYPLQWQALLAAANWPAPLTLRANRRRIQRDALQEVFTRAGIAAEAVGESGLLLQTPRPVMQLPGFSEGWWSVQDAGAQRAAELLDTRDGMRVLDACAAPGGKTAHLLERADLDLLALDADAARLARVGENLDRLGLRTPRVSLARADASDPDAWWDGRLFDAVLADVPCTASGIVRRHPDIRWLRRAEDVARTARLQADIMDALWRTVAPGGRLLYATCSIFPAEGEAQAAAFAARHDDALRLDAPGQLLPIGQDATLPARHDGFFYALFAKQS